MVHCDVSQMWSRIYADQTYVCNWKLLYAPLVDFLLTVLMGFLCSVLCLCVGTFICGVFFFFFFFFFFFCCFFFFCFCFFLFFFCLFDYLSSPLLLRCLDMAVFRDCGISSVSSLICLVPKIKNLKDCLWRKVDRKERLISV